MTKVSVKTIIMGLVLLSSISICKRHKKKIKANEEANSETNRPIADVTDNNFTQNNDNMISDSAQTDQAILHHDTGDYLEKEILDTGSDQQQEKISNDSSTEYSEDKAYNPDYDNLTDKKSISSFRLTNLFFFIGSVALIAGIFGVILLSLYYRLYLYKKKLAPFEAPNFLQCLFPKPVNYEHEITILCSKYMNS